MVGTTASVVLLRLLRPVLGPHLDPVAVDGVELGVGVDSVFHVGATAHQLQDRTFQRPRLARNFKLGAPKKARHTRERILKQNNMSKNDEK